ncbi:ferritin family protein [Fusibacter sp. JL216-2]|uniref:ferritin family protein n=1 Tax=Fusibacter sp. JL216-2 TaxID=3071453 RepID=UPI003D3571FB
MKEFEIQQVKQAILSEVEGYEFYKLAMGQANNSEVKAAFDNLAKEELKHVEWLNQLFEKLKDDDEDSFRLAAMPDPPSAEIFKWDNIDRNNAGLAVSVFSIGMQMEKASVAFYNEAAEKTNIEEAKKLYKILAQWEQVHYDQFAKEYETLKKEWWSDQAYAPF